MKELTTEETHLINCLAVVGELAKKHKGLNIPVSIYIKTALDYHVKKYPATYVPYVYVPVSKPTK